MNDKQIEERNELFDSAVREQMTGYEPQVPHALWNRISSELDMGEASDESTPIAEHHEVKSDNRWKMAIAAAVVLTLTVGTLLYTMNGPTGVNISTAPVAKSTAPETVSQPATAPVQVTETKMVAATAPVIKKEVKAVTTSNTKVETVTAKTTEPAIESNTAKQDVTAKNDDLEFAPVTTQNNPVDLGSIPMASLTRSSPSAVNDEITVIKSIEKKKKHGKKGDDESTKVILLGKKFESRPDIRYQIPVRF